jgi:RNA-directed DNA polymerase
LCYDVCNMLGNMVRPNSKVWDGTAYSLDNLANDAGMQLSSLSRLARTISANGYRQYTRRNTRKTRVISDPAPQLKAVQRALVDNFFPRLPTSDHVFSKRGRDVVANAREHLHHSHVCSLDLRDCYPSTTLLMVRQGFRRVGLARDVADLIARLVTHNGRLPLGPPSSPAVLDCVLHALDDEISAVACKFGARYTRFSDDLSFSSNRPLHEMLGEARRLVRSWGYRLRDKKTRNSGPGTTHIVTGIVVGSDLHAPPEYLRSVAREITKFGRGQGAERSIQGKIIWVWRLNNQDGWKLADQLVSARNRRWCRSGRFRGDVRNVRELAEYDALVTSDDMPF